MEASNSVSKDWIDHAVGRNWEIFWGPESTDETDGKENGSPLGKSHGGRTKRRRLDSEGSSSDHEEETTADDDEADWYAGHIKKFAGYERGQDGKSNKSRPLFQVLFVGDETLYDMCVTPDLVRPCTRTWVERSLALMDVHNNIRLSSPLDSQLPSDTSRLQDNEEMLKISTALETELEVVQNLPKGNGIAKAEELPSWNDHQRIRQLLCRIRQQIYLRSWLVPVDDESASDGAESPSLAYVEFLVDSLKTAAQCCLWYDQCYILLFRVHESSKQPQIRDDVFKHFAEGGKKTISDLVSLDPSFEGFRRKRKSASGVGIKPRRNKRRRKAGEVPRVFTEEESGERVINACQEDFYSTAFVRDFVKRLANDDSRWFSLLTGRMLLAISVHVILPILNWERRSDYFLGEKDTLVLEDPNDNRSDGSEGDDDESDDDAPWVRYEDVKDLLESARTNRVLSKFDFSKASERLGVKMADILSFEERCWTQIEGIFDEDCRHDKPDEDTLLARIRSLIESAENADSSVGNVEPFGMESSPLTRSVLQDAALNRMWFLDLRHAESVRERTLFVQGVLSRHPELPQLPCRNVDGNGGSSAAGRCTIGKRVQALSASLKSNATLFDQQKALLQKRPGTLGEAEALADSGLAVLRDKAMLSVAEEMAVVRKDIGAWLSGTKDIICQNMPKFSVVAEIKSGLDKLLVAESPQRAKLTRFLRASAEADTEIREFTREELGAFCDDAMGKTISLHSSGVAWKDRVDSIFNALRFHGNQTLAKDTPSSVSAKNCGMVDLKRIDDLLKEYPQLSVSVEDEHKQLSAVREACGHWSERTIALLSRGDLSFADALSAVKIANQEDRPKGVILYPTRQILDVVLDLLRWHTAVKSTLHSRCDNLDSAYQLLIEGAEIVELYGSRRQSNDRFTFNAGETATLLRRRLDLKKGSRSFSRAKLESHPLTEKLLEAMASDERDVNEGLPLLALLRLAWQVEAENFAESFVHRKDVKADFTLEKANQLRSLKPSGGESLAFTGQSHWMSEFDRVLKETEHKNQQIAEALAASKTVLCECLSRPDHVRSHTAALKDHYACIKRDSVQRNVLALPRPVEVKLDKEIKLFGWLTRLSQYSDVFRDAGMTPNPSAPSNGAVRIPWDVLVKLYESRPEQLDGAGDFSLVLLRLKELYDGANTWQEQVSTQTLLSLRGGKRRTPGGDGDADDGQQKIDVAKVLEMSASPILKKVAMPREEAVRSILEGAKKFEVLLQDLLGKDYTGKHPDRVQLPLTTSLVDYEGRFILLRLTASPLFVELKASLQNIALVADDVLADTPGKATFDWICKAVKWIEELSACVDRSEIGHGQLAVKKGEVLDILRMADSILLDVPEDLRRTLSHHGIFVSTNKEGRLTVKSKKGAAHHSLGTTAIRWSPVLFEALKEDVARTEDWESRAAEIIQRCKHYLDSLPTFLERETLLQAHALHEELDEALGEASELVVVPLVEFTNDGMLLQSRLSACISSCSTAEIEQEFSESVLNQESVVARDRGLFLDALADRGIVMRTFPESVIGEENNSDLRVAARTHISRALEQGITVMASGVDNDGTAASLCKVRAWEIEEALFSFAQPKGEEKISSKYREKVRLLKRSFGDVCNSTLCAQVLCGEVDSEKLVRMSSDQLANPQIRRDREKIEARAKEKTILTRSVAAKSQKKEETEEKPEPAEATSNEPSTESLPATKPLPAESAGGPAKKTRPVTRSSGPPPPPPSLVKSMPGRSSSPVSTRISNASGSDRFKLSMANMSFSAFFEPKTVLGPNAESFLPDRMNDSHQTKVEEFIEFLSGKRSSGKWEIYTLRLLPCTENDAKEYKRYYKNFESKHRLAMFKLPNRNKLFLITPKFHKEVKDVIELDVATSTYGILLLRD